MLKYFFCELLEIQNLYSLITQKIILCFFFSKFYIRSLAIKKNNTYLIDNSVKFYLIQKKNLINDILERKIGNSLIIYDFNYSKRNSFNFNYFIKNNFIKIIETLKLFYIFKKYNINSLNIQLPILYLYSKFVTILKNGIGFNLTRYGLYITELFNKYKGNSIWIKYSILIRKNFQECAHSVLVYKKRYPINKRKALYF